MFNIILNILLYLYFAHTALVGTAHHAGISPQGLAHRTFALQGAHGTCSQFLIAEVN